MVFWGRRGSKCSESQTADSIYQAYTNDLVYQVVHLESLTQMLPLTYLAVRGCVEGSVAGVGVVVAVAWTLVRDLERGEGGREGGREEERSGERSGERRVNGIDRPV
jgi:hypothetical protein